MRTPDVHLRPDARILVERRHTQNDVRLCRPLGDQVRAANGTKMPELAR